MYRKPIWMRLLREAKQPFDYHVEEGVNAQEEYGKDDRHDQHHDGRLRGFLTGRPYDLADFGFHLIDELAGCGLRHVPVSCSRAHRIAAIAPGFWSGAI